MLILDHMEFWYKQRLLFISRFKIILIMEFNMVMIFFQSQDFQRITAYSFLSSIFRQLMLYSQSFLPGIPTP